VGRSVTFSFRSQVSPARQKDVLAAVEAWTPVARAALLKPGAKAPAVRRMAYALLAQDADPAEVVRRLAELPEVESASIPAVRRLA
jgi:hypothetical protein